MTKLIVSLIKLSLSISLIFIVYQSIQKNKSLSQETTLKQKILSYFEQKGIPLFPVGINKTNDAILNPSVQNLYPFTPKDWGTFIIQPQYSYLTESDKSKIWYDSNMRINAYGSLKLNLLYGDVMFTEKKYKQFDEDKPKSRIIDKGLIPKQELQLHMEGRLGKRLFVYIDHDDRKKINTYIMKYKALHSEEVLREINAGMINIKFNHSKYAVYDNNSTKAIGVDVKLQKGKFSLKAFGSISQGETTIENFKGNASPVNYKLAEYQYIKGKYYQLEPFTRYDGLTTAPTTAEAYNLITFTSTPSNPQTYHPHPVTIDSVGFELYMDDQNPYNNFNAITLSIDNGKYTKLVNGTDYAINYSTGLVSLQKNIPTNARIFAVYTINGGTSSTDPSARTDIFPGKIFLFIKYGYALDEDLNKNMSLDNGEDKNNDGMLNLDIYEVRSYYFIGNKFALADNFNLQILRENQILTISEKGKLGLYTIDFSNGIIYFNLREPFRNLLETLGKADKIYSENQITTVFEQSRYNIKLDYFKEARSFQLKHTNIIPNSVKIKINKKEIPNSLYKVDYTTGFLLFTDPNNPLIGPETEIEIKYEHNPFSTASQSFIGGVRGDYRITKDLNIGGSMVYTRSSMNETIPTYDSVPEETLLLEGDAKLHLTSKRLAQFYNSIANSKVDKVPFEIKAYGEYARSYRKVNSFGKALIDNMESTDEIINISTSEKDWILSSMPTAYNQSQRGVLNYYYYRNPTDPGILKGLTYNAEKVAYEKKPGPYNVATGNISSTIVSDTAQRSLVLDFEIDAGGIVPIVTRRLSTTAVDLSGLQYIELSYRYEGSSDVTLHIDMGRINEDSDGDNILDTEDINNNSFIDSDPGAGVSEDRGYIFNGNRETVIGSGPGLSVMTRGDGILNSEDLNGNGTLDTAESVYSLEPVTIQYTETAWIKQRIYIDQSLLTESQADLLKVIESIRLYIANASGGTISGKIYIDSLKFISSRWRDARIDDSPATQNQLKVTMVNSINDSEYRGDAFLYKQQDTYTSLYGKKTDNELHSTIETALQVQYTIPNGSRGYITRRFTKPIDLRFYKTLNLWFNYREFQSGDTITIRIGSSESDYMDYTFTMDYIKIWKEVTLALKDQSSGTISFSEIVGSPDLKRINYITLIIDGRNGRFWLNDIYVSEPETLKDDAHWLEFEFKTTKPIYVTDNGTPILSDIMIKYIDKGHGAHFSTIGKPNNDLYEKHKELYASTNILPNWTSLVSYTRENYITESRNSDVIESKRGNAKKNTLNITSNYLSQTNAIPSIKLVYKYDQYINRLDEDFSGTNVEKKTLEDVHTPLLNLHENIDKFLWGKLTTSVNLNLLFKKSDISRTSDTLNSNSIMSFTNPEEKEKRQRSETIIDTQYTNSYFFIKPKFTIGTEEIVSRTVQGEQNEITIYDDLNGNYHVPFFYDDNIRFVERNKRIESICGINNTYFIFPQYKIELQYFENSFSDYDPNLGYSDFLRNKDAKSVISSTVTIPFNFTKMKKIDFIKSFNLSYSRSIYFNETKMPYEGEHKDSLNEEYGLSRAYNTLAEDGLNIISRYPGYYLSGRNNFARGRDSIYKKLNDPITFGDGSSVADYDNQLKLLENFSLTWSMKFLPISIDSTSTVNHVSERINILGIPGQVITAGSTVNFNFDLMEIFSFSFFRPNKPGKPFHASSFITGYGYTQSMIITSNIVEHKHSPKVGLTFKWDRASVGINFNIDFRKKYNKEYIHYDESKRDSEDDIYIQNMPTGADFKEFDKSYKFQIIYETDSPLLYALFSRLYTLTAQPIFSLEYSMVINRYDYFHTVSPEPYDMYMMSSKLIVNLHKNIQGTVTGKMAIEQFRNRDTESVSSEVFAYELGINFALLF